TGSTTVMAGTLRVSNQTGSATGTGSVKVNAGNLAGKGIISGGVTIGTGSGAGAILAPSAGSNQPTTLALQSTVTCKADSTYTCRLNTKTGRADQVIAKRISIETGAQFDLEPVGNKKLTSGAVFIAISITSLNPIAGTFANLADGSILTVGRNKYQVSYEGG